MNDKLPDRPTPKELLEIEATPEHRTRISRGKRFEILTVVALLIGGFAYVNLRGPRESTPEHEVHNLAEALERMQQQGLEVDEAVRVDGRACNLLSEDLNHFTLHVALLAEDNESRLETAIVWLTTKPGEPPGGTAELQESVNRVSLLSRVLVPTARDAHEKAVKTMLVVDDTPRAHEKGVGVTNDGWKLTYISYRTYDEGAGPQPALVLVLQTLESASNEELSEFNRDLFASIQRGDTFLHTRGSLKSVSD